MVSLLGEFLGTMVLLLFGCGVVANVLLKDSKGFNGGWIVITMAWGFAVTFGVYTAVSFGAQGDLNPAVTLFKLMMGVYGVADAIMLMLAELAGGFVGAILVYLTYLPHWKPTEDPVLKLAVFSTIPAIRNYKANFLTEFIATFFLLFLIFATFNPNVGDMVPGFGPYIVGILIVALGLSLGGPTGYAMNPARDLGPRIAHAVLPIPGKGGSDWSYSWVPVLAPMAGAACAYYASVFVGLI